MNAEQILKYYASRYAWTDEQQLEYACHYSGYPASQFPDLWEHLDVINNWPHYNLEEFNALLGDIADKQSDELYKDELVS